MVATISQSSSLKPIFTSVGWDHIGKEPSSWEKPILEAFRAPFSDGPELEAVRTALMPVPIASAGIHPVLHDFIGSAYGNVRNIDEATLVLIGDGNHYDGNLQRAMGVFTRMSARKGDTTLFEGHNWMQTVGRFFPAATVKMLSSEMLNISLRGWDDTELHALATWFFQVINKYDTSLLTEQREKKVKELNLLKFGERAAESPERIGQEASEHRAAIAEINSEIDDLDQQIKIKEEQAREFSVAVGANNIHEFVFEGRNRSMERAVDACPGRRFVTTGYLHINPRLLLHFIRNGEKIMYFYFQPGKCRDSQKCRAICDYLAEYERPVTHRTEFLPKKPCQRLWDCLTKLDTGSIYTECDVPEKSPVNRCEGLRSICSTVTGCVRRVFDTYMDYDG